MSVALVMFGGCQMDEKLLGEHFQIFETFILRVLVIQDTDLFALKQGLKNSIFQFKGMNLNALKKVIDYYQSDGLSELPADDEVKFIMKNLTYDTTKKLFSSKNEYVRSLFGHYYAEQNRVELELQKQYSSLLVTACSMFEILIGSLLDFELINVYQQSAYVAKRKVSFERVLAAGSVQKLHTELVQEYIQQLQYASVLVWLNDYLKICTKEKVPIERQLQLKSIAKQVAEIFELRNIIVHNDGIVTQKYQQLNGKTTVGEQVSLNEKQFLSRLDQLLDLGIELFLLNLEKGKQYYQWQYRQWLNGLFVDYLRTQPLSAKRVYEFLVTKLFSETANLGFLTMNADSTDYNWQLQMYEECITFMINRQLSIDFSGTQSATKQPEAELFLNSDFKTENTKFDIWRALKSGNDDTLAEAAIVFLNQMPNKQVRFNALSQPVFDRIRTLPNFDSYLKKLKYTD